MQGRDRQFLELTFKLLREMRKQFDAEAKSLDMTLSRARALLKIQEKEGLTQRELAEALEIESPTLNRLLDKLEQTGFIERRQVEGDKRVRCIFLTQHARSKARKILTFTNDMSRQVFVGVGAEETKTAIALVQKLLANLESGDL